MNVCAEMSNISVWHEERLARRGEAASDSKASHRHTRPRFIPSYKVFIFLTCLIVLELISTLTRLIASQAYCFRRYYLIVIINNFYIR